MLNASREAVCAGYSPTRVHVKKYRVNAADFDYNFLATASFTFETDIEKSFETGVGPWGTILVSFDCGMGCGGGDRKQFALWEE